MLRPLAEADWPGVAALESAAYQPIGLSEGLDQLRSRAGSGTSFVVSVGDAIAGYVLALPYPYGKVPELAAAGSPIASPDLHLHDLVIGPAHRRAGLGSRLAGHLLSVARDKGFSRVSLVSVGGSGAFWTRHGFDPRPEVPAPSGYGPGATYMSRSILT
jgi:GNAT superfamily N-acetyltransferase